MSERLIETINIFRLRDTAIRVLREKNPRVVVQGLSLWNGNRWGIERGIAFIDDAIFIIIGTSQLECEECLREGKKQGLWIHMSDGKIQSIDIRWNHSIDTDEFLFIPLET